MQLPFEDRAEAGRLLGQALRHYAEEPGVLLLALPRGGVPVAFEVAQELGVSLDLMIVRKLGAPGQEELAIGAIASGGARVLNRDVIDILRVSRSAIDRVVERERRELERREQAYRGDRPPPDVSGRTVVLVDDGLATGATMRVAVQATRQGNPRYVEVAVPVAPQDTLLELRKEADEVTCLATPDPFVAVGRWYRNFNQTRDEEVRALLRRAWEGEPWELR